MVAETSTTNGSSDGNLAATYALIYSFLTAQSHEKAAAAVKKAVKDIVVLKEHIAVDGASLEEIVRWWKAKKEADTKKESSSDSDSDSSDSDSSDSTSDDSSDSDSDSDPSSSVSSSGYSSSGSSDSGNPQVTQNGLDSQKAAKVTMVSTPKTDSGKLQDKTSKKPNDSTPRKPGKATKFSSSSSDSDSSSSESAATPAKAPLPKAATTVVLAVSYPTTARATKKRRISESGNAVVTATVTETSSPALNQNSKLNGKKPRKSNTPFQRIKADAVEFHDERLKDNAFVARGGSANDYGARASQDLIVTRGDGFRKEKNKKKRGSYRGGEITMESHSIKFT